LPPVSSLPENNPSVVAVRFVSGKKGELKRKLFPFWGTDNRNGNRRSYGKQSVIMGRFPVRNLLSSNILNKDNLEFEMSLPAAAQDRRANFAG
jgi:hypothetical protein